MPAYRVGEAGRYAGVSARSVSYWHFGGSRTEAALPRRSQRELLSYYQLIEIAFVATFRNLGIPLQRIRIAREYAAQVLNSEYPFAEHSWMTEGRHVLLDLRDIEGEAFAGRLLVADRHGQVGWKDIISDRFEQFDYEGDVALVWHLRNRSNPVLIDPRVSFGAPTVKGIPTWALRGRWDAGEGIPDMQEDFGLSEEDIRHGLRFEGVNFDDVKQAA
jgi:uncharacterized protein (DUF433 family)